LVRFGFASSAFTKPTALHHECIWLRLRRAVYLCVPLREALFAAIRQLDRPFHYGHLLQTVSWHAS